MTAPTLPLLPTAHGAQWRRPVLAVGVFALAAVAACTALLLFNTRADATPPFSGQVVGDTLFVRGSSADDLIVLRLRSGVPTTLDVDFGNDGTADLSFDRSTFTAIQVEALGGADNVRIDEVNGIFTDTEATTLDGGGGNDSIVGGSSSETLIGNGGNDFVQPRSRERRCPSRRWERYDGVESGRRVRCRRGSERQGHAQLQRRERQRAHRHLSERPACAVLPRYRQHHDGPQRGRDDPVQGARWCRRRQCRRSGRDLPCAPST